MTGRMRTRTQRAREGNGRTLVGNNNMHTLSGLRANVANIGTK